MMPENWIIREGERHTYLVVVGQKLLDRGLATQLLRSSLMEVNAKSCDPPLPEAEVESIAATVERCNVRPS